MFDDFSDTDPEVERLVVEAYRRMTPEERLPAKTCDMLRAGELLMRAGIRARYGEISEEEMRLRMGALRLGRETMVELFGWDPEVEGY